MNKDRGYGQKQTKNRSVLSNNQKLELILILKNLNLDKEEDSYRIIRNPLNLCCGSSSLNLLFFPGIILLC